LGYKDQPGGATAGVVRRSKVSSWRALWENDHQAGEGVSVASTDSKLDVVLQYAGYGWRVVPLEPRGKRPLLKEWQKAASSDEETILGWGEQFPDANWGVGLGEASGVIDIECDDPEAERQLGLLADGCFPVCPTFASSRGKHRIVLWRPGLPGGGSTHVGKIELRTGNGGKGAQSAFPPSIHKTGVQYAWLPGLSPSEVDVPELPDELFVKICNLAGESRVDDLTDRPKSERRRLYEQPVVPHGERNSTLYAEACALWNDQARLRPTDWFRSDESQAAVQRRLWAWNVASCKPPLDDAEVTRLCESAREFIRKQTAKEAEAEGRPIVDENTGQPLDWRLIIVDSEPPGYRLFSPHWEGPVLLSAGQFCSFQAVCREALNQRAAWVPTTLAKRWKDRKDSPSLPSLLVRSAEHEEAPAEIRRTDAIAERVVDYFQDQWVGTERDDTRQTPESIEKLPVKMADGSAWFVFATLWESLAKGQDKVTRNELSAVLRRMGCEDRTLGSGIRKRTVKWLSADAIASGGNHRRRNEV
jgi:hypothetical protein